MMTENKIALAGIATGFVAGIIFCTMILTAQAHPPCDAYPQPEQQPTCGYVQAINPITGVLEQHYVCK
jgi:hypothetical protein